MESEKLIKDILSSNKKDKVSALLKVLNSDANKEKVISEVFDNLDCTPMDIGIWEDFIRGALSKSKREKASRMMFEALKNDYWNLCEIRSREWHVGRRQPFRRLTKEMFSDCEMMSKFEIIGHPGYLKSLLVQGANVNQSIYGYDLLNIICTCELSDDLFEMVRMVLKAGADPDALDSRNSSAIMGLLCYNYNSKENEVLKELLKAGADINVCDKDGKNAVLRLIESDYRMNCASLLQLLIDNGALFDIKDNEEIDVWHHLFWRNRTESAYEIAKVLINAGMADRINDYNYMFNDNNITKRFYSAPLPLAGLNESEVVYDLIKLLLDNGANPNSLMDEKGKVGFKKGFTTINTIAKSNNSKNASKAIQLMLIVGCNPNMTEWGYNNHNAIYYATKHIGSYSLNMIKMLINNGIELKDEKPLYNCINSKSIYAPEIFYYLLTKYPLQNNEKGWQLLYEAANKYCEWKEKKQLKKTLLQYGFTPEKERKPIRSFLDIFG